MKPNFLEAFKPILVVNQFLGIITFSYTQTKIFYPKIRCIVNIFMVLLYIPVVIKVWQELATIQKHIIIKTTDVMGMVGAPCYVISIWIYSIIKRKKCAKIVMKIMQFDAKLLQHPLAYEKQKKRIMKHMGIRFLNIILAVTYSYWYTHYVLPESDGYTSFDEFVYDFTYVLSSALCHQVTEMIYTVKLRFEFLNERILQLKMRKLNGIEDDRLLKLSNICAMHHELSKVVKLISKTFGVFLLLMFGFTFMNCVVSLFYFSAEMQQSETNFVGLLACLSTSSCFTFDAFYLCDVCYWTIEEAKKSGELIHKIKTDDNGTKVEIVMFSLQIANEQLQFDAAGFFPINYTLLLSMIGGATTYVIILVQLAATIPYIQ